MHFDIDLVWIHIYMCVCVMITQNIARDTQTKSIFFFLKRSITRWFSSLVIEIFKEKIWNIWGKYFDKILRRDKEFENYKTISREDFFWLWNTIFMVWNVEYEVLDVNPINLCYFGPHNEWTYHSVPYSILWELTTS